MADLSPRERFNLRLEQARQDYAIDCSNQYRRKYGLGAPGDYPAGHVLMVPVTPTISLLDMDVSKTYSITVKTMAFRVDRFHCVDGSLIKLWTPVKCLANERTRP